MFRLKVSPSGKASASYVKKRLKVEPPLAPCEPSEDQQWVRNTLKVHGYVAAIEEASRLSCGEGEAPPPGLVNGDITSTRPRTRRGLGFRGRDRIQAGLSSMEEKFGRDRISFLTVSLPDSVLSDATRDGLSRVWHRFLDSLTQALRRAKIPIALTWVCEGHPLRSRRMGRFIPHWHVAFLGRRARGPWTMCVRRVKRLWALALQSEYPYMDDHASDPGVRLERVQKSVCRYMSKYLSKGNTISDEASTLASTDLLPARWFGHSKFICELIRKFTIIRVGDSAQALWEQMLGWGTDFVRANGKVTIQPPNGPPVVVCEWLFLRDFWSCREYLVNAVS